MTSARSGRVRESGEGTIILRDVPIVTPNCDVVVPSLTVTITRDTHLLISGERHTLPGLRGWEG